MSEPERTEDVARDLTDEQIEVIVAEKARRAAEARSWACTSCGYLMTEEEWDEADACVDCGGTEAVRTRRERSGE